jgi:hypothetical protein
MESVVADCAWTVATARRNAVPTISLLIAAVNNGFIL